jgi:tetratricopeptide (TPR) repeat protein
MRANIKEIYKDHAGAIDDLTSAIKNNNKFAEAYYKRGIVKFNLSDSEGARMDLEKANSLGFTKASVFLKKKYNMNESTLLN